MKKMIFLFIALIFTLTACDQLPEEIINIAETDSLDTKDTVKEAPIFNGVTQNEETDSASDTLSSTFFNLNSVLDRQYKSGIINKDTLQIILLSDGNPSEEFELFYNNNQDTIMGLSEAFDINKINLEVVDDEEKLIFEITYTEGDKSVYISKDYADIIIIE